MNIERIRNNILGTFEYYFADKKNFKNITIKDFESYVGLIANRDENLIKKLTKQIIEKYSYKDFLITVKNIELDYNKGQLFIELYLPEIEDFPRINKIKKIRGKETNVEVTSKEY